MFHLATGRFTFKKKMSLCQKKPKVSRYTSVLDRRRLMKERGQPTSDWSPRSEHVEEDQSTPRREAGAQESIQLNIDNKKGKWSTMKKKQKVLAVFLSFVFYVFLLGGIFFMVKPSRSS